MSEEIYHPRTAQAGANIALIKYWGKRSAPNDGDLNLPSTGSLSITLKDLFTVTEVACDAQLSQDEVVLNGQATEDPRIFAFLSRIRDNANRPDLPHCRVNSTNNFPTAAGLASSASGFAALAMAASHAYGLTLDLCALSQLARVGSGSAPRSLVSGFALMHRGQLDTGADAVVEQVASHSDWPLEVVIAITSQATKAQSSRFGMLHSMATSPYYPAWVASNEARLGLAQDAVRNRDFEALSVLSEASTLQMHACALGAEPGVLYWTGATVECLHVIRALRASGSGVFFTIDAGPQVKAICLPGEADAVLEALSTVRGVVELRRTGLGPGAWIL